MLRPPGKPEDAAAAARRAAISILALLGALVPGYAIAALLVVDVVGAIAGKPVTWFSVLNWLGMLASCTLALSLTREIGKYTHSSIISFYGNENQLRDRGYVLYLRPFEVDKGLFRSESAGLQNSLASLWKLAVGSFGFVNTEATNEERILRNFLRFGRVIGVGRPGEEHPLPGAERFYIPLDDWRPDASEAIRHARLVLMVAAVRGKHIPEGTLWEFTETLRLIPPSQFLLLMFSNEDEYQRFKEMAFRSLADRAATEAGEYSFPTPVLPNFPTSIRSGRLHKKNPLRGIVGFNDDWVGEFVEFAPNHGRVAIRPRRDMKDNKAESLMEIVERGLPGDAVPAPGASRWEVVTKRASWLLPFDVICIHVVIQGEELIVAQKVALVIILLLFDAAILVNGFYIQELIRRHGTEVSFSRKNPSHGETRRAGDA
ncbi:hypothetical protein ACH347_39335 [Saccharopolyspora sp. 5N102]|uniref:hypothetical protein n=1 Tax=Saccharopolyspora sp. 5N102 TaxID=3375155 RepID=UPI00379FA99D